MRRDCHLWDSIRHTISRHIVSVEVDFVCDFWDCLKCLSNEVDLEGFRSLVVINVLRTVEEYY